MSKRIITKYNKLNSSIKNVIQVKYPHGIEMQLTKMKHLIKGHFFDGFVFEHDDTTYLIECRDYAGEKTVALHYDDQEENELEDDLENIELDK